MLGARSDIVWSDMVRILALHSAYFRHRHFRIHVCIFTEALPHARPGRITAEVHGRREGPWHIGGAALVCRNLTHVVGVVTVECRGDRYFLRKKRSAEDI